MPTYEYRCENPDGAHLFEVVQRMSDGPVTACPHCGATVQRVFSPVAVHFKGSGFYNTDYGTAKRKRENEASAKSGADSNDAKTADKKTEKKTETASGSSDGASSKTSSTSPASPKSD